MIVLQIVQNDKKKDSSSKDLGRSLTDYEKERHMMMEKNAMILEKLGLPKLVNQMREIKKGYTKKGSEHPNGIYRTKSRCQAMKHQRMKRIVRITMLMMLQLLRNGKKQSAVTTHKKLLNCLTMSMSDLLIQQQEQHQHSAMKRPHKASQTKNSPHNCITETTTFNMSSSVHE
ncbi:hypothetical protein Cgig2_006366 [Carnegiea gigantea]|uniref:Uncharacterized protein n=1 Tax=Carnegiea gigantea TaxID=171969 RepID=A0A9Q1K1J6_9CARY|nr:hypothetical protein Cgig2_006366 [Carnegiea gigantea]